MIERTTKWGILFEILIEILNTIESILINICCSKYVFSNKIADTIQFSHLKNVMIKELLLF